MVLKKQSFRHVWWDVLPTPGGAAYLLTHGGAAYLLQRLPQHQRSPSTHLLGWPEMSLRENWGQNMSSILRLDDLLQISWPSSSPFITLLSCSISIIAIIRRWLTKWQRCSCSVSPRHRTWPSSEQQRGWNRGWRWQDDRVRFPSLTSAEPGPTQRQQNPPEPLTLANVVVHLLWVRERSSEEVHRRGSAAAASANTWTEPRSFSQRVNFTYLRSWFEMGQRSLFSNVASCVCSSASALSLLKQRQKTNPFSIHSSSDGFWQATVQNPLWQTHSRTCPSPSDACERNPTPHPQRYSVHIQMCPSSLSGSFCCHQQFSQLGSDLCCLRLCW